MANQLRKGGGGKVFVVGSDGALHQVPLTANHLLLKSNAPRVHTPTLYPIRCILPAETPALPDCIRPSESESHTAGLVGFVYRPTGP